MTCSRGWHIINGYVIPPCADDTTQEELTRLEHAGRRIRRWTIPSERSRARLLFSALVEACIWKGLVCISPHDLYVSLGDTYVFPRDVRLPVSTLSFQSLAFILSLVHPPGDAVGGPISAWAPAVFLRRYAGPWPRLAWTRWVFFGGPWIQLHYHMRVFTAKLEHSLPDRAAEGVLCHRETERVEVFGSGRAFTLVEKRYSVAITSCRGSGSECPWYTAVGVTDSDVFDAMAHRLNRGAWKALNIHACGEYTGIAVFQVSICRLVECWHKEWARVLFYIDDILKVQVSPCQVSFTRAISPIPPIDQRRSRSDKKTKIDV